MDMVLHGNGQHPADVRVTLTASKKSRTRTGCSRCKTLHHKCTEERPRCARCVKFSSECIYPSPRMSKDGHHINNVRGATTKARPQTHQDAHVPSHAHYAPSHLQMQAQSQSQSHSLAHAHRHKQPQERDSTSSSSEGSPVSNASSPPVEISLFRPTRAARQRDSMDFLIHRFAEMAEYMNTWCIPIASEQGTSLIRNSWATAYLPRLAQRSEALSSALCCYTAHRMRLPDFAVGYYQDAVHSLRQSLFALQNGTFLSTPALLEMWCTTYILSEVESLIGQFEAITLHIRGALQLYKLLARRLRQGVAKATLDRDMSNNVEVLIGNMAVCSIKSMQLPEQVAEVANCFNLPNQPVGTLLGHAGECYLLMDRFRAKFPFRLHPSNDKFDAYAAELNAVLNRIQAHRGEILGLPGSECVQSVTDSPFSPTIVFLDENLTMPFCATHLILLLMAPHLEPDLLQHTTRNALGLLLGMSFNKQTSRGKHFALIGAYLQDPLERRAFLQHCTLMSEQQGIPAFEKVAALATRCWQHVGQRYGGNVQNLSCLLVPLITTMGSASKEALIEMNDLVVDGGSPARST